jgi:hypothetical protein
VYVCRLIFQLYGGKGFMRWMKKGAGDESGGVYGSEKSV